MATVGSIAAYSPGDDWKQYVEQLKFYLQANGVGTEEKKRATFLTVVGPATFRLLRSLIAPAAPADKSFEELVEVLTKHYSPPPSEIIQRFKFHSRFRRPEETAATFVSELRALSEFCNFGATLDSMLRDRLVCGIQDDQIQKRLLAEPDLTFTRAMELAQSLEAAARNVRELRSSQQAEVLLPGEVHQVRPPQQQSPKGELSCYRCGKKGHTAAKCRFKTSECHLCGKVGHLKAVCRSKERSSPDKQPQQSRPHSVRQVREQEETYPLFTLSGTRVQPWLVTVEIDQQPLTMEIDTGASLSLVSAATYKRLWPLKTLQESQVKVRTYSGEPLVVLGSLEVKVRYKDQDTTLTLTVVEGDGPSLLGRDWLQHIRLDWSQVHSISTSPLESMLDRKKALFQPGLGTLKDHKAKIHVDATATPKFCKARPVPYAMRRKVEEELERLTKEGIVEPIRFAEWAAPVVPVLKSDRESIRLCGDYKLTVNQMAKPDQYPIPRLEDLFATLAGGKTFTKLDMSQAYQQIELDEESKQYVVINTHKGLYRYNRLPFGVSAAPAIFQRVMEGLLQGIDGAVVYLDDILVTGQTEEEHLSTLEKVLDRMEQAGLRLKRSKCSFMAHSVVYLGHRVDSEGLHPNPEKVEAVVEAPRPNNVSELKAYLGLLTYYGRFLPNLSTVLAPLYALLKRNTPWRWDEGKEKAFQASKQLLVSSDVLVHFDPSLRLILACDASPYGIGAVLSHQMPDGSERPIAFASRSLTPVERRYAQIEREGLACVYGVKKFHSYLFGQRFTLQTDNKPLLSLFSEHKPVSPQASGRIQRWALALAMYEYQIAFKPTTAHSNADAMSRLPLPVQPASTPMPAEIVCLVESLAQTPVTAAQIQRWTRRDSLLSQVLRFVERGWPEVNPTDPSMRPFWTRRGELSMHDGCILWGSRVLVPPAGRRQLLQELHAGHQGMAKMKSLARTFFWWPNLDADIEAVASSCEKCQLTQGLPPSAPLHPWTWPSRPWSRIHLDYAGPIDNRMFLVLIDAHTKWLEVFPMSSATASATIRQLRITFAQFGLPHSVVTDNGPCFASEDFRAFLRANGVQHVTSAPYHPASNGQAERAVQVFKQGFKRMKDGTVTDRIARFLFSYRITPHSTTGSSPAELMFGRKCRSRLDLLLPDLTARVESQQQRQKEKHDMHAHSRMFSTGERVYARNFRPGEAWLPGCILKAKGPVSFLVKLQDGRVIKRHIDHIRKRLVDQVQLESSESVTPIAQSLFDEEDIAMQAGSPEAVPPTVCVPACTGDPPSPRVSVPSSRAPQSSGHRYPSRTRAPPEHYRC